MKSAVMSALEEYEGWLDKNMMLKDEYRRLGSIFPRLSDLEFELECFQRDVREVQLIKGLKDPYEFSSEERKHVLAQVIREKKEEEEYQPSPRLRGLKQAKS